MKKSILLFILIIGVCALLTGCFDSEDVTVDTPQEDVTQENVTLDVETNTTVEREEALTAIRNALKNKEWVDANLKLTKDCFGEDVVSGDQKFSFRMFGDDKVAVETFAYDDIFGMAFNVVYYKDGEVKTCGNPGIDSPYHPGHTGFVIDPDKQVMDSFYMHMGYYSETFYEFVDEEFVMLSDFRWNEYDLEGNYIGEESGDDVMTHYEIIKGDDKVEGEDYYSNVEEMAAEHRREYNFVGLDYDLTDENVDLYIK